MSAQSILDDVRLSFLVEDLPKMRELAAKGIQLHPDSPELWAMHTTALLWSGDYDGARLAGKEARELNSECALAWSSSAEVALLEGQENDAAEAAETALSLDDNDWIILSVYGSVHGIIGNHDRALFASSRRCEIYPNCDNAINQRILHLTMAGQVAEAESLLNEAERRFPESPCIMRQRARRLMRAGLLDQSIEILKKAAERSKGSFEIWGELSSALCLARRYEEAESAAQYALRITPITISALRTMQIICKNRGEDSKAAEWGRKADIAIPMVTMKIPLHPVTEAIATGDWKKAVKLLEKPLSESKSLHTRAIALGMRAKAFVELKRYAEAEKDLVELEQLGVDNANYFELTGSVKQAKGDTDGAIKIYRKGLSKHPLAGGLRSRMLRIMHEMGNIVEETSLAESLLEHPPSTPWDMVIAVITLDDTNHKNESRTLRLIGKERFPEDEAFRMLEAVDRFETGDIDGALRTARGIRGEMRDAAGFLRRGATILTRLESIVKWLKRGKPDDRPPTVH